MGKEQNLSIFGVQKMTIENAPALKEKWPIRFLLHSLFPESKHNYNLGVK